MSRWTKFLIGLAAVILLGILHHGPLGRGQAFVDALSARAKTRIAVTELPGITADFGTAPLTRFATLSGVADEFQRNGLGSYPGLTKRIATIPGVSGVRWFDEPAPRVMPLIAETLLQLLVAYLLGIGIGRLWFGRRVRTSYLD